MSDTEGVSEGGNSDGPGRDESVSPETEASVEEAMSDARDEAAANDGAGTLTEDDARATQERMEAEGKAARESFERQERARAEATAYADALDQETAALNDAAADAAYAEALDQEVAALEAGLPVAFDDVALEPTLRDQILSDPEAIQDPSDLAELDEFLASDAGIAAARQFEFDRALQSSNLTPDQVTQAMGHFTAGRDLVYDENGQITTLEDGTVAYEVLVADADGGFDALAADDGRSAAEIAADYARGLNETVAAVANSSWGWAAGLAFDAVALAAGGPVRFAVNMAAGEGAAALLEQGLEVGAEYLAEQTGMEPDDIAHLAIAGGTILGGAVLGWRGVKEIARNLPERLEGLMTAVRRFRDDESGSVPSGGRGLDVSRRQAADVDDLPPEVIERYSFNHEQGRTDLAQGIGIARLDGAIDRDIRLPDNDDLGVDLYLDDQPISLKGPILNSSTGSAVQITDEMVDGLVRSTLADMRLNTATGGVVIDTLGMNQAQRSRFASALEAGMLELGDAAKPVIYLE